MIDLLIYANTFFLVQKIIGEEKLNSFNVPKELEALIQTNGNFNIERMEKLSNILKSHVLLSSKDSASMIKAILEGFIEEHFGNEFVDQIFNISQARLKRITPSLR